MTQPVEPPTLDQVLDLVERLPLADQARLVEQVLPRLTHALTAEGAAIETSEQDAPDSTAFAELIQLGGACGGLVRDELVVLLLHLGLGDVAASEVALSPLQ